MSTPMQTLTDQLTTAVAPCLSSEGAPSRTLKGVAKTLKHLAKQLTKQQVKQEQAAQKAAVPTAKKLRKALAGELLTALRPHLGLATVAGAEVPKVVAETLNRLAVQLIKQRRKQAEQAAKVTRKAAKQQRKEKTVAPILKVVRLSLAAKGQPAAARRAPSKRATPRAAPAPAAVKAELATAPA